MNTSPVRQLRNKQNVLHLTMEHYLEVKRAAALTCATTWMDLENTVLSERSQTQTATWCVIPFM